MPKKCNQENMKKLVLALESDEYRQGEGHLCQLDSGNKLYCCLGVATDLMLKEKGEEWVPAQNSWDEAEMRFYPPDDNGNENDTLSSEARKWLGLRGSSDDPIVHKKEKASQLNDGGSTFKQIAQFFRSTYGIQ